MARRRRKGSKTRRPDPVDVVAGRADAGVGDLFHLIHELNPTGRELPPQEEARLYRLKAGLQSLLLRRFGEQIVVRAESAEAQGGQPCAP